MSGRRQSLHSFSLEHGSTAKYSQSTGSAMGGSGSTAISSALASGSGANSSFGVGPSYATTSTTTHTRLIVALPPTSSSSSTYAMPSTSASALAQQQANNDSQRRESLVKPTWQNVCPGQLSPTTLAKINGLPTTSSTAYKSTGGNNNQSFFQAIGKNLPRKDSSDNYDIFGKVMLLGDSGVGKTCLLVRFRDGTFLAGNFISTVGIDFGNKVVQVDNVRVKLQIWDTAGQERFRSVTHAYYRDAHALLLLYDVTNKISFDNIRAWLVEIKDYAQDDVVIMLLGNKSDSGGDREVRKEEGERLAREYNVAFMETSAKSGINVELAFLAVAKQLKCKRTDSIDDSRFNVQDFVREQTSQKSQSCSQCIL